MKITPMDFHREFLNVCALERIEVLKAGSDSWVGETLFEETPFGRRLRRSHLSERCLGRPLGSERRIFLHSD